MEDKKNKKKTNNEIMKYSGMAFQMFAVLMFFAFIGQKLDHYFELPKPFITVVLLLLGITGLLYKLYIDVSK